MIERALIEIRGLVQGVGFRPFIYSLATSLDLRGSVLNCGSYVAIDVEGSASAIDAFLTGVRTRPPSLARVDCVDCRRAQPAHHRSFVIGTSSSAPRNDEVQVTPDVATCAACIKELFDRGNRRFRHPFITCTTCGPRFTVVRAIPYDRARTTMAAFEMCDECRREYDDPADRRFHAQAIACNTCGPTLSARDRTASHESGDRALQAAIDVLLDGGIVAVKGLGGYHLACDATNAAAVDELRRRKHRDGKPFAVMLHERQIQRLDRCVDPAALELLRSPQCPIVLIDRSCADGLSAAAIVDGVAAGCPSLGVMLPYTPLHHLLLSDVERPLVMTSGNRRDEPMAHEDEEAWEGLADVADLFLTHDRRIQVRCDDTVVRPSAAGPSTLRRARGHAPTPLTLRERAPGAVLAVGGHLKNTICLVSGRQAYVSSHIGDLGSVASYRALVGSVAHLTQLFAIRPEIVAHDLHPDYLSTRFASELTNVQRIAVQHHHAHVLSCVAEHGCTAPVIGVAFDGAGLGTDGAIWGGEFLLVEGTGFQRIAHLTNAPLPGGDVAAREPWRMAVAQLAGAYGPTLGPLEAALAARVAPTRLRVVRQLVAQKVAAPSTSSMGRLFDAVAAIIGLRDSTQFEGQAAMELEAVAAGPTSRRYRFEIDTSRLPWQVDPAPVVRAIVEDVLSGRPRPEMSMAFHEAVAAMVADVTSCVAKQAGIRRVALTGGVFQNALLTDRTAAALATAGLDVLVHREIPCNDGGLSVGQAVQAIRMAIRGDIREAEASAACV